MPSEDGEEEEKRNNGEFGEFNHDNDVDDD